MQYPDSADNEYHLTPEGWIPGTEYIYGEPNEVVARPGDAIETWVRRYQQSTSRTPERIAWQRIWASAQCSEIEISNLKRKFPTPV